MAQLRLAMVQLNPVVGDLGGNAAKIRARVAGAAGQGAHLVAFGEMALVGYPVEDLALRRTFVDASRRALTQLAAGLVDDGHGEVAVVVGYLDEAAAPEGLAAGVGEPLPQNCAAVLHRGQVVARYAKQHLPNYGVFDERRIFAPGADLTVVRVRGVDVAIAVCEDLWVEDGPVETARDAGAELLLVLNGSPYERTKGDARLELCQRRTGQAGCPLAYVNLVGGQDDLVFDGDSVVVGADGAVLARALQFRTALLTLDLDLRVSTVDPQRLPAGVRHVTVSEEARDAHPDREPVAAPPVADRLDPLAEVWEALALGLGDYVRKNDFGSVLLGVSGGIDSAVVAALAADAIGGEYVVGISNPSQYSSQHSKDDAAALMEAIGGDYRVIPIQPMVDAFHEGVELTGVAAENLQARVRAVIWMGISNQEGHLVLANSNKSEISVGYSTIYGDSVGGFAPIKDVPKSLVWELARWRNAEAERRGQRPPIPQGSIDKAPSAELRPDQVDQDSLPPYDVLDPLLKLYVDQATGRAGLVRAGFDAELVDRVLTLVDRAEWKRRQGAPGTKISALAFGRDRRLPITSRWREHTVD